MAGNNAIGTGAIILTANADQVLPVLSKITNDTTKFAKEVGDKIANVATVPKALSIPAPVVPAPKTDQLTHGLDGATHRVSTWSKAANTKLGRLVFGTPEHDAKSGDFLGRIGGLTGQGGLASRAGGVLKSAGIGAAAGAQRSGGGGALAGAAGGLIGGAFGGPIGSAIGGQLAAGLGGPMDALNKIRDKAQAVRGNLSGINAGALDSMAAAITRADKLVDKLTVKFLTALAPAVTAAINIAEAMFQRWEPYIDKAQEAFSALAYTAVEVFGQIVGVVVQAVESVARWVDEITGAQTATTSGSSAMFNALRLVGKGAAYVWDTFKVGAGVISIVSGAIVVGFGEILKVIGKAVQAMADLAAELPDAIRPDWIGRAADTTKRWADNVGGVGKGMMDWGKEAITSFGESSGAVDKWFDGVEQRFKERKDSFGMGLPKLDLAGAYNSGSKEAYSIVVKNDVAGIMAESLQRQALNAVKEGNKLLGGIKDALGNGVPIKGM